jgi:hypothetical protein
MKISFKSSLLSCLFSFVEAYISKLHSQAIAAKENGNKGRILKMLMRCCVAHGVRRMYCKFKQVVLGEVQRLADIVAGTISPSFRVAAPLQYNTEPSEIWAGMIIAHNDFKRNS